MGGNWRSRSRQKNARENEIGSRSAFKPAAKEIRKDSRYQKRAGGSTRSNIDFGIDGRDSITVGDDGISRNSICHGNFDTRRTKDDTKAASFGRTNDHACWQHLGDLIGVPFTFRFPTARSVTCSEYTRAADDTEYDIDTGSVKFAVSDRHCFFQGNCDTGAVGQCD